ncbi:hypothetical protein TWF281_009667 [Arthrobotrys megalospora]
MLFKLSLPVSLLMALPLASAQAPSTRTTTSSRTPTTTRTTTVSLPPNVQTLWGVCGGDGAPTTPWTRTICESGAWCSRGNSYLHQCLPVSMSPTATAPSTTTTPLITTTPAPLQTKYGRCGGIGFVVCINLPFLLLFPAVARSQTFLDFEVLVPRVRNGSWEN